MIQIQVGTMRDGKFAVKYTLTGTDRNAISRALEAMEFHFRWIDPDGALIFTNTSYTARYQIVVDSEDD